MNVVRAIASAMDEAIDQKQSILFPVHNGTALHIAAAHGALARWGEGAAASILTIPFYAKEKAVGAFTFERSSLAFEQDTIDQIDAVVTVVGPLLELKRAEDRWLFSKAIKSIRNQVQRLTGPHHYRRKVAAAAVLALVGVVYFLTWDYRLTAPATLEGLVQRVVAVPFDGYLSSEHARAGDTVRSGQVLAALDDRELVLKRHVQLASVDRRLPNTAKLSLSGRLRTSRSSRPRSNRPTPG